MSDNNDALNTMSKEISNSIDKKIGGAAFDKTGFGIITGTVDGGYTVQVFGGNFTVKDGRYFSERERVAVTAMQGNFSNLILHKITQDEKTIKDAISTMNDTYTSALNTCLSQAKNYASSVSNNAYSNAVSYFRAMISTYSSYSSLRDAIMN